MGLDPERLYPSVFAGNETTPADDEAFRIWNEEIGIPAQRIFKFGKEDNFWEHGSGPCGPCSEIYYDRGPQYGCGKPGCTVGCDCDRYMEVWNVVFSQFDNDGENHYTLKIFHDMLEEHQSKGEKTFSGADAFKRSDTYGFPMDLTLERVEEQGMELDEAEFHKQMDEQRQRARKAREALGDLGWAGVEFGTEIPETQFVGYDTLAVSDARVVAIVVDEQRQRARKAREALGDLGWAGVEFGKEIPETQFVGYDTLAVSDARVVAIVVENEQAEELMPGVEAIVVLDKTPFYAEMGGQTADHGTLCAGGAVFQVTDVQKNKGGKYMHSGKLTGGVLKLGDTVQAQVDAGRRQAIMRAHSATHLLDAALRKVLGDHVHQAGSLVEPDRLRFDFTHFSALTAEELAQVSAMVNEAILSGYDVVTEEMPIEQAKQRGAIALFGEKYGNTVRVVDMGNGYSVEFCGGTHLDNTAKVGVFHISSEFSVASGVRRIEASTGRASLAVMNRNQEMLFQAAAVLKAKPGELREKAEQVMSELKNLNHTLEKFRAREAANEAERFLFAAHEVGGLKVLTATVPDADAGKLRKMGDLLRDKEPSVVGVLAAVSGDKITFLAVCGKEAVKAGVKAGDIVKQVSAIAGGSGGGKPDSAMGGGKDPLMLDNALAMVDNVVSMKLGL